MVYNGIFLILYSCCLQVHLMDISGRYKLSSKNSRGPGACATTSLSSPYFGQLTPLYRREELRKQKEEAQKQGWVRGGWNESDKGKKPFNYGMQFRFNKLPCSLFSISLLCACSMELLLCCRSDDHCRFFAHGRQHGCL